MPDHSRLMKTLIRNCAKKIGYQVQKYPTQPFSAVPVFHLSVQLLMALRGHDISFIQVGANDGRYGDPLHRYIEKYPWRGILVEPQPDVFDRLCANYAAYKDRLIFENVAIDAEQNVITMYKGFSHSSTRSGDALYDSSVVSVNPNVAASQLGLKPKGLESFTVPCVTLDELSEKHGLSNIDLLQIDTEGHDYVVLKTLNLSKIRPMIIQFEHGHLSPKEINGAVQYLDSHGYRILYGGHQIDTLALHERFLLLTD